MISVFFLPKLVDIIGHLIYYDMSYFKDEFWQVVDTREKTGLKRGDYIDSILTLKNMKQDDLFSKLQNKLINPFTDQINKLFRYLIFQGFRFLAKLLFQDYYF